MHQSDGYVGHSLHIETWIGDANLGKQQINRGDQEQHFIRIHNGSTVPRHVRPKAHLPDGVDPLAFSSPTGSDEWAKEAQSVRQVAVLQEEVHAIGGPNAHTRVHVHEVSFRYRGGAWRQCRTNLPLELIMEIV